MKYKSVIFLFLALLISSASRASTPRLPDSFSFRVEQQMKITEVLLGSGALANSHVIFSGEPGSGVSEVNFQCGTGSSDELTVTLANGTKDRFEIYDFYGNGCREFVANLSGKSGGSIFVYFAKNRFPN